MEKWTIGQFLEKVRRGETGFYFLYTPFCGTCHLAERMVAILEEMMPEMAAGKSDINYMADFAREYQIQSVPCLLLFAGGEIREKIYAFHSVSFLYEQLQGLKGKNVSSPGGKPSPER
jgi:Thioredoxin.